MMRKLFLQVLAIAFLAPLSVPAWSAPNVRSAMLVNLATGKTLYQRNPDYQIPPASLTKIMTMFLTFDAIKAGKLRLNQKITIGGQAARIGGSSMSLNPGEKVPVVRLLAGMAVASGNDAATAIATQIGGTPEKFAGQMNRKARALGMTRTVFKNPTGLPAAGQKTTARDMARLCASYLRAYPKARRFHSMTWYMHKGQAYRNTNPLLGVVQGVDGMKTGWTIASGYNLIITATRGKTRLLAIVLGGSSKSSREAMARKLIEAGFRYPGQPASVKKVVDGR